MTLPATDGIIEKLQALLCVRRLFAADFQQRAVPVPLRGIPARLQRFRRAPMARIVYVIAFSLYFYYKSSGIYFLLLVFAAASDFLIARASTGRASGRETLAGRIERRGEPRHAGVFQVHELPHRHLQPAVRTRLPAIPEHLPPGRHLVLRVPVDELHHRHLPRPAEAFVNWLDYLFYLSFFPQLVAGPIVRARDFIPQIRQNPVVVTREMFGTGVFLILTGLFKKAIISDYISLNFVDRIFDEPLLYSGFECLMGIYGYALQIYCDFSGYSDMAIGIALLLGFRFPKNFDAPTSRRPSPNSGGGGTSRSRRGCATTSTSRWAATARAASGPTATCSSRCCWADCGTARRAFHPLGRAARRGAGAAQTVDGRRSGRQGHRGADALVEPCGGHASSRSTSSAWAG